MELNKNDIQEHIAAIELTEILCGKPCDICKFYGQHPKCMPVHNAEKIAAAGYRKASEVALEVIEEASKLASNSAEEAKMLADTENDVLKKTELRGEQIGALLVLSALAKLKKKYTESEKNDDN